MNSNESSARKKSYQVRLSNHAEKNLGKIESKYQQRIYAKLDELAENPLFGKKLMGEYEGRRSIRSWPYRIIYSVDTRNLIIFVSEIRHRQEAYNA